MRIILVGRGSFISRAVAEVCASRGVEHLALGHEENPREYLRPSDTVINFAISPTYRFAPYDAAQDYDLRTAEAAVATGAHFVMLSTRRVYACEERWNATEMSVADGDETVYGRNKAITEKLVRQLSGGHAGIFRLANIFGYEYSPAPRRSFLGQMLHNLREKKTVFFDMHPASRRDFIPVETCAELLTARATDRTAGTYNLGSGVATPCGDVANWVIEGFGSGQVICDTSMMRDEFYLNMQNWRNRFELPVDSDSLREYCKGLGERLACEKF